jgi:hypothetical protein
MLVTVTVAPGTTAAVWSVTVPAIAPEVSDCAETRAEYKKNAEKNATTNQNGRRAVREAITIIRFSSW